jgi:ADP-ribosylglycohydrolase
MLADQGRYDPEEARKAYVFWLNSGPFDYGATVASGLRDRPDPDSQANGAMMRISPLGIFGARHDDLELVAEWARQDAAITHHHPILSAIQRICSRCPFAHAVRQGCASRDLYEKIVNWAEHMKADARLLKAVRGAAKSPPAKYVDKQGWVLTAFRNALWQLLHAPNLEEAVVDTVKRGGDTDTNAAICGALMGAVYGRSAVPARWVGCLLKCRPAEGRPNVRHPRPECFWPVDALELAERLVGRKSLKGPHKKEK